MFKVDLNCDLGEYRSVSEERKEIEVMPLISSTNIACGLHAGDDRSIRKTMRRAFEFGVGIGSHPSFPDRDNFGRKAMVLPEVKLRDVVCRQITEFINHASACGVAMTHVKAHGALYNMAAVDLRLATVICETIAGLDSDMLVFGLANSRWVKAAEVTGLQIVEEVFSDRRYLSGSELVPRVDQSALITDVSEAEQQVLKMVHQNLVTSIDGVDHHLVPGTVCIHGDSPEAYHIAVKLRSSFERHGVKVMPP
ncbi:MAG: LamB/YcsF family protein [Burkholderiales bacterium]|nr:LamB/YcsF family protein [Burkholderiales bacterium]OUT77713.1 MAG: hypothetical protein CBB82_06070 [Betaproteobacteria bacterium TMED22]|tara:strand:- start:2363 stop:3118 length:756 start_codon:yes stop_codon:yes gene_type:complete